MYLSFIHQIISVIFFINFYQLVHSDQNFILPTITNDTQNRSFNLIVRMITFGVHGNNDEQQKDFRLKKDSDSEQMEELRKNPRLLFLPLMIRMLFERIAEHDNTSQPTKNIQKFYQVIRINFLF